MEATHTDHWELLSPEDHDEAAEFFEQRAKEALAELRPNDPPAVRDRIEAVAERRRIDADHHRIAAERKRRTQDAQ